MDRLKVMIVDDDSNIAQLIRLYAEKEGWITTCCSNGMVALQEFNRFMPDVVILDIIMPQMDGWETCRRIREFSMVPIIMLTAKGDTLDVVSGLDMGADDYIAKPFGMTELVSRVKAVLRRYQKASVLSGSKKEAYSIGNLYVNPEKHIIKINGEDVELSFKEYQLLMILLEAEGKVVKRDVLLTKVWGEFYDESRTLDVHIRKLRIKLENSDVKILTVKNVGYRLGGAEDEQ